MVFRVLKRAVEGTDVQNGISHMDKPFGQHLLMCPNARRRVPTAGWMDEIYDELR